MAARIEPPYASPAGPRDVRTSLRERTTSAAARCHRVHTDALFGGAHEIEIEHREAIYRLRITSLGKLILTK
jgi:hemin uptake protein HemP